jgi:MinD-like ATPase involved in chromosome partitioning or flagellar assembly
MSLLDQSPMTWLDVARRLATILPGNSPFPPAIAAARVGWFGLLLEADAPVQLDDIAAALETLFPSRVKREPLRIELEGTMAGTNLPVEVETGRVRPSARQPFGVVDGTIDFRGPAPQASKRRIPIAAALSVKGGTGRTTTAVAFALHWAASVKQPILLVDADLEAPGISYLFEAFAGKPKISLEDLITLAHAEEADGAPETTRFVAERLRDHHVPGDIFILPLRRDIAELASSAIRPEHLSTPERPFALADLLADIAEQLGAAGVVVDVRAGLVPVGVNLAMDPDVSPIIVTSLGEQSIRATSGFATFLAREFRRAGAAPRRPLLVVNRVPLVFRQTGMDKKLVEPLVAELINSLVTDAPAEIGASDDVYASVLEIQPFIQVNVPELPDLQVPTGGWRDFIDQLRDSGFARALADGSDEFLATELSVNPADRPALEPLAPAASDGRRALEGFANQLIAAENVKGEVPRPLVTQPLSALALRYRSEVPIAIAEGAKGTGKTLAARFIVSKRDWSAVVKDLSDESDAVAAYIVPIVASVQSSENFLHEVDQARRIVSEDLGFEQPLTIYETTLFLKDKIAADVGESAWASIWLDTIAWSVGFRPGLPGAGEALFDELRSREKSIVAIFEGLEELYTAVSDPGVESAMRALLIALPQRLRSAPRRPIGLLTFVRRDTVEAAIRQNLDQFRRENMPFALTWTEDDVLELAAWLATQSGAIPGLWTDQFHTLSSAERASALVPLWGTKLGPDDAPGRRTREAYAATWIIAVLSDLRGRLVPRDLVRLLANAAKTEPDSEELEAFTNRLLIPRALRTAVDPTSTAKVSETEEEIGELKPAFAKFKLKADELSVPLTDEVINQLGLDQNEVSALVRHGIIFGDKPPYEVPELFRRGLGLKHAGARRSVVNLYNRARKLS